MVHEGQRRQFRESPRVVHPKVARFDAVVELAVLDDADVVLELDLQRPRRLGVAALHVPAPLEKVDAPLFQIAHRHRGAVVGGGADAADAAAGLLVVALVADAAGLLVVALVTDADADAAAVMGVGVVVVVVTDADAVVAHVAAAAAAVVVTAAAVVVTDADAVVTDRRLVRIVYKNTPQKIRTSSVFCFIFKMMLESHY